MNLRVIFFLLMSGGFLIAQEPEPQLDKLQEMWASHNLAMGGIVEWLSKSSKRLTLVEIDQSEMSNGAMIRWGHALKRIDDVDQHAFYQRLKRIRDAEAWHGEMIVRRTVVSDDDMKKIVSILKKRFKDAIGPRDQDIGELGTLVPPYTLRGNFRYGIKISDDDNYSIFYFSDNCATVSVIGTLVLPSMSLDKDARVTLTALFEDRFGKKVEKRREKSRLTESKDKDNGTKAENNRSGSNTQQGLPQSPN